MGDAEEPVCVEDEEDGFLWAQVASGTATPESAERWLAPEYDRHGGGMPSLSPIGEVWVAKSDEIVYWRQDEPVWIGAADESADMRKQFWKFAADPPA